MLKYLQTYDKQLQAQVQQLIDNDTLGKYLLSKYNEVHSYGSDKALYGYVPNCKLDALTMVRVLEKLRKIK